MLLPKPRVTKADNLRLAQYAGANLAVGKLLVSKPNMGDPNFAQSVVLIVEYDSDKGALGVILNRRTKTPLSKLFPQLKGATDDPVYEGGPVETNTAQALLRSKTKPPDGKLVFGDVYATGNKDAIEASIASGAAPDRFRLYVGYGGWSTGQLEHEIELGGWSVLRGNPGIAFDDDPDSLWTRMQHDADTSIASVAGFRLLLAQAGGQVR